MHRAAEFERQVKRNVNYRLFFRLFDKQNERIDMCECVMIQGQREVRRIERTSKVFVERKDILSILCRSRLIILESLGWGCSCIRELGLHVSFLRQ